MSCPPIRSMTGYATAESTLENVRVKLEIKSLNHRFTEVKVRLPKELSALEFPIRKWAQSEFARGSIEIKLDSAVAPDASVGTADCFQPQIDVAAHYYQGLLALREKLGIREPIQIRDVTTLPGVFIKSESLGQLSQQLTQDPEKTWNAFLPLFQKTLTHLEQAQTEEGRNLAQSISKKIDRLNEIVAFIKNRRTDWQNQIKDKLKEKISKLFEVYPLSQGSIQTVLESRISQEIALSLDRTDIDEELTRLGSHFQNFRKVLDHERPVGKKLDFMVQEVHRELTTLGNKAQDYSISEQIIECKILTEQIREQAMNLA